MPTKQLNYWIHKIPNALYANLFGPTETTDICTYYIIDREFKDDEIYQLVSPVIIVIYSYLMRIIMKSWIIVKENYV